MTVAVDDFPILSISFETLNVDAVSSPIESIIIVNFSRTGGSTEGSITSLEIAASGLLPPDPLLVVL